MCIPSSPLPIFHGVFYWQKDLENRDKNQAQCTQRALDIKESNGELLWHKRDKKDSSATILKEMISLLSLIVSSSYRERARYRCSLSIPFSSSWLQNRILHLAFSGRLLSSHWDSSCIQRAMLSAFSVRSQGYKGVQITIPVLKWLKDRRRQTGVCSHLAVLTTNRNPTN